MPEVIDIIVLDDDVPDARPQRPPRAKPIVIGALAVAALVTVAVLASSVMPGGNGERGAGGDRVVVAVAARSMASWAHFATTGDLDAVAPAFDRHGPQFMQLASEAPAIRARHDTGPPYVFELRDPRVVTPGSASERIVRAGVVVRRAGEEDQRFAWDIVLRRHGRRWTVWTARDRVSGSGTP